MIINVFFDDAGTADVITVPSEVGDIEEVQKEFFNWLFDKKNDHRYWVVINGEKEYCNYETEAFIEWINNVFLKENEKKAKIIKKNYKNYSMHDKKIFF